MKLSDFDYDLPEELIAQYPLKDRVRAKLLHIDRHTGDSGHATFTDLTARFRAGDLLVLNNTKVIPARLLGKKETGGNVEAFLTRKIAGQQWEALLKPGGKIRQDSILSFGEGKDQIKCRVMDSPKDGVRERRVEFLTEEFEKVLERVGHTPLPPYIHRPDEEQDRVLYQTVFAKKEGAVASPTAGLHFDEPMLETLKAKGVEVAYVTLHVSYGTFQPIPVDDLTEHIMFEEAYEISQEAALQINRAKAEKRRVIACGTTVVRTLESSARETGQVHEGAERTRLFIYPPYEFKIVDGMITNFHLPKSSLFVLVAAFLGVDKLQAAYREAVKEKYRFFSYGDAMAIF